jgi:hypothetical protein
VIARLELASSCCSSTPPTPIPIATTLFPRTAPNQRQPTSTRSSRAFAERERKPRLEYLATVCPRVEPALLDAGFRVEARLPVLTCAPEGAAVATVGSPIELMLASADDELRLVAEAQNEAYGAPDAAEHDVARSQLPRATVAYAE